MPIVTELERIVRLFDQDVYERILAQLGMKAPSKGGWLGLGLASIIVYLTSRHIIYPLYINPVSKIPGPPVEYIPFAGNFRQISRAEAGEMHKLWTAKYGGLLRYHGAWNKPRILVTDPALVKEILTTHVYDYRKSPESSAFLARVLGNGLLISEGEVHRHQRKALNPAFSVQTLRDLIPMMFVPTVRLRDQWLSTIKAESNDSAPVEINVSRGLSLLTLDVIGLAGFGEDFHCIETAGTEKANPLSRAYMTIFSVRRSFIRILGFFFPIFQKLPTKENLQLREALRWLNDETVAVVNRGIERTSKQGPRNTNNLLALMIKATEITGTDMTRTELKDHSLTFLAAGHETTSSSMSWCLWLLAQHQDIQDALREEVRPLFENVNTNHPLFKENPLDQVDLSDANLPTYEEINSLQLLNNVCKEVLRLIPVVPITDRMTTKDTVLGNQFVPKGTRVFLAPIVTHHSAAIWGDDVMEFRPSRWNEEPAASVGPYEYMPFLAGNRQCIGYRFALIEMKIILATLITHFQFFEKPGFVPEKKQMVTVRPWPNMTLLVKAL